MGMVHGVVHNHHVFASSDVTSFGWLVAFQTDAVITHTNITVDNQGSSTIRQVDAVSILNVPFRAYGDSINDDVLAEAGMHMKSWCVLNGNSFQ